MKTILTLLTITTIVFCSCGGSKEVAPPPKVESKIPTDPPQEPPRRFSIIDRYYVRNAALASPKQIDDPLQAIRVIQLAPGESEVLVLFTMDDPQRDNAHGKVEMWFGIEMKSFSKGTYDFANITHAQFFKFDLSQNSIRYDGQNYSGTVTIEGVEAGHLIGSIDATIKGETRSFEKPSEKFQLRWQGSFRVAEVPLEATQMK